MRIHPKSRLNKVGWDKLSSDEQQQWRDAFSTNINGKYGVVHVPKDGWTTHDEHIVRDVNIKSPMSPGASGKRTRKPAEHFEGGDVRATGNRRRSSTKGEKRPRSPSPADPTRSADRQIFPGNFGPAAG